MNDNDLTTIIRDTVMAVLRERGASDSVWPVAAPLGRVLVAVCCDDCLNDESRAAIAALRAAGFVVSQPAEDDLKKRGPRDAMVAAHDVVLLPAVGDDDAAKMALGIFDEPVARVALGALALGVPLIAALHAPYEDALHKGQPALQRVFDGHRRALEAYGFTIVPIAGIEAAVRRLAGVEAGRASAAPAALAKGRRRLVTAEEVEAAARKGESLKLPAGALVTPLARDRARELGLVLEP